MIRVPRRSESVRIKNPLDEARAFSYMNRIMELVIGFEPMTYALRVRCSTS